MVSQVITSHLTISTISNLNTGTIFGIFRVADSRKLHSNVKSLAADEKFSKILIDAVLQNDGIEKSGPFRLLCGGYVMYRY